MEQDVIVDAKRHTRLASLASLNGDLETALTELILATECYAEAIRDANSKSDRKLFLDLFNECAEEAERVKERRRVGLLRQDTASQQHDSQSKNADKTTLQRQPMRVVLFDLPETRAITKREQVFLLKSSKLGDRIFPVWNSEAISKHLGVTGTFTDDAEIFEEGSSYIYGYKRLQDCIARAQMREDDLIIYTTLSQTVLNDCSLVASLIVASQWSTRFRARLITNCLYPQNDLGQPTISDNGKYMLKVYLNGAFRQVVVDDLLPIDHNGSAQHILAFSANHPEVCWPALVNKAFRKLGGKDFRGSNSAADLRLLTGWIPEQISVRGRALDTDAIWERLYKAWVKGDVLITLGTSKLSLDEEKEYGIASEHNYAVVGLRLDDENKLITVQNPWRESGSVDHPDSSISLNAVPDLAQNESSEKVHYKTLFDIEFRNLCIQFNTIFLNWNPTLWSHQLTMHCQVSSSDFSMTDDNLSECPQLVITNFAKWQVEVTFLLSIHRSASSEPVPGSAHIDVPAQSREQTTYTALSVYDTCGSQVIASTSPSPVAKTDYHGSFEIPLTFRIPRESKYTVVTSQRCPRKSQTMTMTVYHHESDPSFLSIAIPTPKFAHALQFLGKWIDSTAGGNPSLKTYVKNPQFRMTCHNATPVLLILETDGDQYVNVDIVHGTSRPLTLIRRALVVTGREYRIRSQSVKVANLEPGQYTVVVSTYKPGVLGNFKLSVFSDSVVSLTAVKPLGAGLSKKILESHWSSVRRRQIFEISVERMTEVTVHVHPSSAVSHSVKLVQDQVVVASTEGRGSLGLEGVSVHRKGSWTLQCDLLDNVKGNIDFELQVYSDCVLQILRG